MMPPAVKEGIAGPRIKPVTILGIALAMFGGPAVIFAFNQFTGTGPLTDGLVMARELAVFAVTGLLLLLIRKGERLGFDSIGLHGKHWGKSLLLALIGLLISIGVAVLLLFIYSKLGVTYGSGGESKRYEHVSLWTISFMILRAGVVEEICYRGYLMERFRAIYPAWLFYFLVPLVVFALLHYRQGIPGIVIAFVLGGVLAFMYSMKRDLKANIVMHFLADFIPNVIFPLLG